MHGFQGKSQDALRKLSFLLEFANEIIVAGISENRNILFGFHAAICGLQRDVLFFYTPATVICAETSS